MRSPRVVVGCLGLAFCLVFGLVPLQGHAQSLSSCTKPVLDTVDWRDSSFMMAGVAVKVRLPQDLRPWGRDFTKNIIGGAPGAPSGWSGNIVRQDWESDGSADHLTLTKTPMPAGKFVRDKNEVDWHECADTIRRRPVVVVTSTRPAGIFGASRALYTLAAQIEVAGDTPIDVSGRSFTSEGRQRLLAVLYTFQFWRVDSLR